MRAFAIGVIVGLVLATVGFNGFTKIVDHWIVQVKETSTQMAK